jgi:iron(III) transport system ATP-binding protein
VTRPVDSELSTVDSSRYPLPAMTEVRLEHITKAFGEKRVIDDLSLTIHAGEVFFLLGPSGCGKSTLLRLIAGLHEPNGGQILFNGRDVTRLGTEQRNAAMCFQSYALWPHMTVRENVRFGLDVRKVSADEAKRRTDEAIALVQLQSHADKKPNELSGGQQQRVALARALVVRPDCLLLDEPLSNLDAKLRLEMRSEIRRICRASNLTAIYVTHDQKEALSIADRMAVLNGGRIEQLGPPRELYRHPRNAFVAGFMGETNFIPGTIAAGSEPGRTRVSTPIGELVAATPQPQSLAAGTKVRLSVRPETIHVGGAPPADAANVVDGTLRDTLYLGEVGQHVVTVGPADGSIDLHVFEINPQTIARDGASERVRAWFDPRDVVVLEA